VELKPLKLKTATAAISIILFAANFQITNADEQQQQQQPQLQQQQQQGELLQLFLQQLLTGEPATAENGTTTTIQSTNDSFRTQVPQGWIIEDRNNTNITLATEVLSGYGLVAQLCPAGQQQQPAQIVNTGVNTYNVSISPSDNNNDSSSSCQKAQEVIHVIRYPNLGARLQFDSADADDVTASNSNNNSNSNFSLDNILAFQLLKLQEVGYGDIRIVNSEDTTIDVISSVLNNRVIATISAKLVEMEYSTNFAPNETRTGYFLSTATDLTPHNLGMTTGYGIFYEHNSTATGAGITTTSTSTAATATLPLPAPVAQVFDSFELMAGAEAEQAVLASLYALFAQAVYGGEAAASDLLTVEIDSNGTEGTAPAILEFEADITGGTEPYTISWDLNDDGIAESNEQSLVATFNEAGAYDIVLTVADIEGQIASDTMEITVEEGEEGGENEGVSTEDEDDNEETLEEETTQEQNQCDSLYPIACIPSSSQPNLTCNDVFARNFELLQLDPNKFGGDDDNNSSSDEKGCETESNQLAGFGELDNNSSNFGSDNLLNLYGPDSP
jgi:PKD repeat protein